MPLEPDISKQVQIHSWDAAGNRCILNAFPGDNGAVSASFNRFDAQRKLINDAEKMVSRWQEYLPFHTIKVMLV